MVERFLHFTHDRPLQALNRQPLAVVLVLRRNRTLMTLLKVRNSDLRGERAQRNNTLLTQIYEVDILFLKRANKARSAVLPWCLTCHGA